MVMESIERMDCGRAFQSFGAMRLKALRPMVDIRAGGMDSREADEERRERDGV